MSSVYKRGSVCRSSSVGGLTAPEFAMKISALALALGFVAAVLVEDAAGKNFGLL